MKYAECLKRMRASEIREILKLTQQPDVISFAGGMPSPDSFPIKDIKKFAVKVLEKYGWYALQYNVTEGLLELREALMKRMRKNGIKCNLDEILITTGSQQAISLAGKIFLDPGDFVIIELPSFLGAIYTFNSYQARYIPIPVDENGMVVDDLEKELKKFKQKKRIKMIYTVPTFHNPTGVTMSLERRKHLLEIAEKYDVPILEDDPYFELRYSGKHLPSIKSLDKRGIVIYTSTFSKILSPGMRLGWVIGNKEIIRKMAVAKQADDLHTSVFDQYIAYEYLRSGLVNKQITKIKRMYKRKIDIMLRALEKHFPKGVKWTKPDGGLFLWITLPEYINTRDTEDMFGEAIRNKVAFVHGASFFVDRRGHNTMRLNFSNTDDDRIEEGIKRLAKIIKRRMK